MRSPPIFVALLCVIVAGTACWATSRLARSDTDPRISVIFDDVLLREAIDELCSRSNQEYVVTGRVPESRVSVRLRRATVERGVARVIRAANHTAAGLQLANEDGILVIDAAPDSPAAVLAAQRAPGEQRVFMVVRSLLIRKCVDLAFRGSWAQQVVEGSVPDAVVDLEARGTSLDQAIVDIVESGKRRAPRLAWGRVGNIYVVYQEPKGSRKRRPSDTGTLLEDRAARVDVNLRDTPLRLALTQVVANTSLQVVVHPRVPNVPITINVRDLSVGAAMRLVVRLAAFQVPGLHFWRSGTVYVVENYRPPNPQAVDDDGGSRFFDVELYLQAWERIPLRYANAARVAVMFGGRVAPSLYPSEDHVRDVDITDPWVMNLVPDGIQGIVGLRRQNALLVAGTPEAIQDLKNILRTLDVPLTPIRIKVRAGGLSVEGSTVQTSLLRLSVAGPEGELQSWITPVLLPDGRVRLEVEIAMRVESGWKRLETTVSAAPGVAVDLGVLGPAGSATSLGVEVISVGQQQTQPSDSENGSGRESR